MKIWLSDYKPLFFLLLALLLRSALLLILIVFGWISLSPDEAQYWSWGQSFDISYYSKPPMIGWQNGLLSYFFGNSELVVRSGALFLGSLLILAVYVVSLEADLTYKQSAWTAFLFGCTPFAFWGSFFSVTDTGMLLMWTLALGVLLRSSKNERIESPFLLGFFFFLGALYKWPLYFLVALTIPLFYRDKRVWIAVGFSFLALMPSLIWNVEHDWATFRHVGASLFSTQDVPTAVDAHMGKFFFQFLGAQLSLWSPLLFIIYVAALIWGLTKPLHNQERVLLYVSFLLLLPIGLSFFGKVQGNWGDFALPSSVILAARFLFRFSFGEKLFAWTLAVACSATLLSLVLSYEMPLEKNPFKQALGWRQLKPLLFDAGVSSAQDILVSDSYQMTALLNFYGPVKGNSYFFNLQNKRKNHFSYKEPIPLGRDIYFVAVENTSSLKGGEQGWVQQKREALLPYFSDVEFVHEGPLWERYGKVERRGFVFKCVNFNGKYPKDPGLY